MIRDAEFIRGKVPMTKQEIRTLTLAAAQIDSDSVVVDVGAGTGSITIEAARVAKKVFAVERKVEAIELVKRNVEKFSVDNVEIICAEAPEGLSDLPAIDVVIIGGSGGKLDEILDALKIKRGGRVVVNAITIQTAAACVECFKRRSWQYEMIQVQVTRFEHVGSYDMAKALNPVWIITAERNDDYDDKTNGN